MTNYLLNDEPSYKTQLITMFRKDALLKGEFKLASGQTSPYYVDSRKVLLSSEGLYLSTVCLLDLLSKELYNTIGGIGLGGGVLVGALLGFTEEWKNGFLVRKEVKDHGTKNVVEGNLPPGAKVLVVEDVCTSGESAMKVCECARNAGAEVIGVACILSRGNATEFFQERGIPFYSVLTLSDLIGGKDAS